MKPITRALCAAGFFLSLFSIQVHGQTASEASASVWQHSINDMEDWQRLAAPERDAAFSKFVLDVKTGQIYFFDAHVFKLHIDFGLQVLLKQARTHDSVVAFNRNYAAVKPQFILGYITHYPKLDLWTMSFWEGDAIGVADVKKAHRALQRTFLANVRGAQPLYFRPDSLRQERMAKRINDPHIPVIQNDKIYQKHPFVAFNVGQTIGTLRIVPVNLAFDALAFKTDDVVVLQQAYPDISPVAGIITTQFSTPLAHVNLRATAWGIPNAGYKNAASEFAPLNNQLVAYAVTEQGLSLRAATQEERVQHEQRQSEQRTVTLPAAQIDNPTLAPLHSLRAVDARIYGSKTANLGEIMHGAPQVHVPDGFGVPFYYYQQHIAAHGIQAAIDATLNDARFGRDVAWRKAQLAQLQSQIQAAPIDVASFKKITAQWRGQLHGAGVFVRSSTNAEDLKGFNGAGLYDSVPNVKTDEALAAAIKKVWASVWNERAVNERVFMGMNHREVYPGVLIQTAVNASAAGVLLTTDIWGHNPHTYTINAKFGLGMRVVEGQKIPEQILYDASNHGTRIISRSNETTMLVFDPKNGVREVPTPAGDTILTESRARALGDAVQPLIPLFSSDAALDVEWVLEGEKIWIVQARPYVVKQK